MQQMSAHICDRGGGFVDAISFLAEKKLPYRFILQLLVYLFLSEDSASGFSFNSFLLVTCLFPEMQ